MIPALNPSGKKSKKDGKMSALDKLKLTDDDDSLNSWYLCNLISKSVADFEKLYTEWKASDVWRLLAVKNSDA